jgi:hypothetical protein
MEEVTVGLSPKQRATLAGVLGGLRKGTTDALVLRIEQRMRTFWRKVGKEDRRPAIEAYAMASRIAFYAEELENDLSNLDPVTERRMINVMKHYDWESRDSARTPPRRRGKRCLKNAASAATDVVFAAAHAQGKASKAAFSGKTTIDAQFRELCAGVALDWQVVVGRPLQDLKYRRASDGTYASGATMTVRQHPLWIVLDALCIQIDAYTLDEVIALARQQASARLRRQEWRRSVPKQAQAAG